MVICESKETSLAVHSSFLEFLAISKLEFL